MKIRAALAGSLLLFAFAACEIPEDEGSTAADRAEVNTEKKGSKDQAVPEKKNSKDQAVAENKEPQESVAQESARRTAESYLDMSAFSRSGLIDQLKFEGFSIKDATYGVDAQDADWNEQAAASAESYLEMSGFSRQSLIEQLVFEGFTPSEAEYGVNKVGL